MTPKATPVAKAPPQNAPVSERVPRLHVRAPIAVVSNQQQWDLESGNLIIGRDPSVQVVLDDPLVSRFHARLTVAKDGRVSLEDLQSANGIFVNGIKLPETGMFLEAGDRLLVGTTELSVFALRPSRRVPQYPALEQLPARPTATTRQFSPMSRECDEPPRSSRNQVTGASRIEPIDLVGQFAEQLMESGHPLEAARVLSEHLQNLLKGATAGLNVPVQLLEKASLHALRLHEWTQRTEWLEYLFEIHMACLQVPSEGVLRELQGAVVTVRELDESLISYFVKTIERRSDPLSSEESSRLQTLVTWDCSNRR